MPFTILRATQFHDFVAGAFRAQRRLPKVITVDVPFQPIDTRAVAVRLASLVGAEPANGRVDDLGGPEVLPMAELARQWLVAREEALKTAASVIRATPEEVPARLAALMDERKRLEKELAEAKKALALGGGGTGGAAAPADEAIAGVNFSGQVLDGLDPKELRPLLDAAK
ncbi:MAG: hypothetical protein ACK4HH_02345, partial [Microcella sp.]